MLLLMRFSSSPGMSRFELFVRDVRLTLEGICIDVSRPRGQVYRYLVLVLVVVIMRK